MKRKHKHALTKHATTFTQLVPHSHPHFLKARELVLVVACSVSGLIVNVILEIALYEAVKTDEGPAKDQEESRGKWAQSVEQLNLNLNLQKVTIC